jgi:hypothetical protein
MGEGIDRPSWGPGVTPSIPVDPAGKNQRRRPGEQQRRKRRKDAPPAQRNDEGGTDSGERPEGEEHHVDIVV